MMGAAVASGGSGVGGAVVRAASTIGGAIAGESIEEAATRQTAQEIIVTLSNVDTIAVVQDVKAEGRLRVGEHVQVLHGGGGTTVRRLH